jgi:hypothetical protein
MLLFVALFWVAFSRVWAAAERRPVLYNGDDSWIYECTPQEMDPSDLEGIVNRLADAKVTIFSNTFYYGGHCLYDTQVGERFGQDHARTANNPDYLYDPPTGRFARIAAFKMVDDFERILASGNEPLKVLINASHKRGLKFLACLRMNDLHRFWDATLCQNVQHPPRPVREHPEFAMKRSDGTLIGGMDFQYPEVRDFVFKPMQELATNYDVDGLELDWMRWVQMFSETVPKAKRIAVMTEYHRQIRRMLDEVGKKKGKHLLLSIRVPQTLEECDTWGFDVATYAREGLIDILCPSDFMVLDPHMELDPFLRFTRGTKVMLLPSLHAPTGDKSGLASTEIFRAVAHSYYEQGADGLSVYNWFHPLEVNLPENYAALSEFGDPDELARKPREYLFNPMWGRETPTGRLIDYEAVVSRSAPGKREVCPLLLKEDFSKVRATLKMKVENLTLEDEIRIDVNGEPLNLAQAETSYNREGDREDTRWLRTGWDAEPYYVYQFKMRRICCRMAPKRL